MKLNLILPALASLALAVPLQAAAELKARTPLQLPAVPSARAVSERLVGIARVDGRTLAAVGPRGRILLSRDRGRSWLQKQVPVSSDLVAVHFSSPQLGWAVGHDGVVLHTKDGGESWTVALTGERYGDLMLQYYQVALASGANPLLEKALQSAALLKQDGADKPFLDVFFENAQSGWIMGAFNLILKTSDGGATWHPWLDRTDNDEGYTLYGMARAGDDVFLVGELGLVRKLDRASMRFVKVTQPYQGSLFGVAGKPGLVVVFGLRGNAFASRDQGVTWKALDTGQKSGISAGRFLEDGRLLLANVDGQLLLSADDGATFASIAASGSMPLNGVAALDHNALVLVGESGIRRLTIQ